MNLDNFVPVVELNEPHPIYDGLASDRLWWLGVLRSVYGDEAPAKRDASWSTPQVGAKPGKGMR